MDCDVLDYRDSFWFIHSETYCSTDKIRCCKKKAKSQNIGCCVEICGQKIDQNSDRMNSLRWEKEKGMQHKQWEGIILSRIRHCWKRQAQDRRT